MTMIAACHFKDGAVVIGDSRASWKVGTSYIPQDALVKILPIAPKTVLGYSGDVSAANLIIKRIRLLTQKKKHLQAVGKLATDIPRIAKFTYKQHRNQSGRDEGLSLIICGIADSSRIEVWRYESPSFQGIKITDNYTIIGSGQIAEHFLRDNYSNISKNKSTLKNKADALLVGLTDALSQVGIDSVGGMLQVWLVTPQGFSPLRYGYLDLDPEDQPNAKSMERINGSWVQKDITNKKDISLIEPGKLLTSNPARLITNDFNLPTSPKKPKWHLTYFLTCQGVKTDIGSIEFSGVGTIYGKAAFPLSINLLVAVGFWGSAGDYEVKIYLNHGSRRSEVYASPIHIEYQPEDNDILADLTLNIETEGSYFLEFEINGEILGRRALYFGLIKPPPSKEIDFTKHINDQFDGLFLKQQKSNDPLIESGRKPELVYFFLCQNSSKDGPIMKFEGQMMAVYWHSYPLPLRAHIATAFRLKHGKHDINIELVNAATGDKSLVTSAKVESKSSCIIDPIDGDEMIKVPSPGMYYLNIMIDNFLVGTQLLVAETENAQYLTLLPDQIKEVASGQLLIMPKRAISQGTA